jgi:2-haloacid dehalogenase
VQDSRIARSGIAKYFDGIFISQRVGYDKPSREFFERCFAEIEGFSKDEAIIVGDSLSSDILGGINAGIRTCRYNPEGKPQNPEITPDYEIKNLSELPSLLERI